MIGAALTLFATTGANAQVVEKVETKVDDVVHRRVHWGIEGGVNLNWLTHLPGGESTDSRTGGFGGIVADIGGGHFTFQPSLRYIYKGGQTDNAYEAVYWRVQTNNKFGFHYIELPLNAVWHSGGTADGFMIGAGPFVSYLCGGSDKYRIETQSLLEGAPPATVAEGKRDLTIGHLAEGGTSRWDAGLGAFIGYQFPMGVNLKVGAEWGMVNLRRNLLTAEDYGRNTNVLFSLGYMFGHKKCVCKE